MNDSITLYRTIPNSVCSAIESFRRVKYKQGFALKIILMRRLSEAELNAIDSYWGLWRYAHVYYSDSAGIERSNSVIYLIEERV